MTALPVLLSGGVGLVTGWLYFVGLRATVEALVRSGRPGVVLLVSYIVRSALAAAIFIGIARYAGLAGIAAALLGFVAARFEVMRRVRRGTAGAEKPE